MYEWSSLRGGGEAGDNGSRASSDWRQEGRGGENEQVGSVSGLWIPAKGSQPRRWMSAKIRPARSGGGETKYVSTPGIPLLSVFSSARKLMRPVWVTMGTRQKWQEARGQGELWRLGRDSWFATFGLTDCGTNDHYLWEEAYMSEECKQKEGRCLHRPTVRSQDQIKQHWNPVIFHSLFLDCIYWFSPETITRASEYCQQL